MAVQARNDSDGPSRSRWRPGKATGRSRPWAGATSSSPSTRARRRWRLVRPRSGHRDRRRPGRDHASGERSKPPPPAADSQTTSPRLTDAYHRRPRGAGQRTCRAPPATVRAGGGGRPLMSGPPTDPRTPMTHVREKEDVVEQRMRRATRRWVAAIATVGLMMAAGFVASSGRSSPETNLSSNAGSRTAWPTGRQQRERHDGAQLSATLDACPARAPRSSPAGRLPGPARCRTSAARCRPVRPTP